MKVKNIFLFIMSFFSYLTFGNDEIISYFSRVTGSGFNDDYYKFYKGEWSSYIKIVDEFPMLYLENKVNGVKIETDAYSDGGQEPSILKIEETLICDKNAIIVSTSEILGIENPTFLYYRYIYIENNNQYDFMKSVLDDSSTKAGGLLPSAISSVINNQSLCLNP